MITEIDNYCYLNYTIILDRYSFSIFIYSDEYNYLISFISEQLTEIKKVRLSRVLCDNGDNIVTIQPFAMELPSQHKYIF